MSRRVAAVNFITPWAPGSDESRERALRWVLTRRMTEGFNTMTACGAPVGKPWIKAEPIYRMLERSWCDIVVVSDADVWCDLSEALQAVRDGAPWAIPHDKVFRFTEAATERILAGEHWEGQLIEERAYRGLEGGGIVVARREVLLDVPPDALFVGWGQEDDCWGLALNELVGKPWRGNEPLLHLWHPPQERWTRRRGSLENWRRRAKYMDARGNPAAMRALVEEGRPCSPNSSTDPV